MYAFICIDFPVTNQLSKDANLENKINFAIFLRVFFFFHSWWYIFTVIVIDELFVREELKKTA